MRKAFTIVELMIVIALFAVLTGGFLLSINIRGQLDKSNDARRKSDIKLLTESLEHFYSDHGCYPTQSDWSTATCNPPANPIFKNYINRFPCDPETKKSYTYLTIDKLGALCDGTCGSCYGYRLLATLKNKSDTDIIDTGYTDADGKPLNYGKSSGSGTSISMNNTDELFSENGRSLILPTPQLSGTPVPTPHPDSPATANVMVIDFNPIIESAGNLRIRAIKNWNDPKTMENQLINALATASAGVNIYKVVERHDNVDGFPVKDDGFSYTDQTYLDTLNDQSQPHQPDMPVDYLQILNDYHICDKVNNGEIQELWLWGGPWFGFWPTTIAGNGSFYIGAPPIVNDTCEKPLIVMGFRYDQNITAMISNYAARAENALSYYFNEHNTAQNQPTTNWGKFSEVDSWSTGKATCGLPSHSPNALYDNDWGSLKNVIINCDGWKDYPIIIDNKQTANCSLWGCTQLGFDIWWLTRLPHAIGQTDGYWNNWWKYININE
jgi:prepilin-type N-terminal cleavage/methylation domain-containing protein